MNEAAGVLVVARRELHRMTRDPLYVMLLVVLPVVSCVILAAIFVSKVPRDLPVAVADEDHTSLSRRVVRAIDATPGMRVVPVVTADDAGNLVRRGEAYAAIVVPRDIERDVVRGAAPRLVAFYDAQALLPASLIRRDLRAAVGTIAGGIEVRAREARGESRHVAIERIGPVRLDARTLFNVPLDYSAFLVTALLPTLLQLTIVVAVVHGVGVELKDGSAGEWLEKAGGSTLRAMIGKLLPYTVHFVALGFAMLAFLFGSVRVPMRGSYLCVAGGMIVFVLAYEATAVLVAVVTANLRFGTSVAAFYSAPAFAFVGITFPVTGMPLPARVWSALLPLTHFLDLLVRQAIRGASSHDSLPALAVMALSFIGATAIAWPRAAVVLRSSKYWGRV